MRVDGESTDSEICKKISIEQMKIAWKFLHLSDKISDRFSEEIIIRVTHSNYRGKTQNPMLQTGCLFSLYT